MSKWADATAHSMGGGDHSTPKKEIKHIETRRSDTKGDHVHVHHHTHPDHHPAETHTTRGDDEMAAHMMANVGTQNPGEAQADAAGGPPPDPNAAAGAPPAAAPPTAPAPTGAAPGGM
jgi:hypothetical protein